jgi:hypothetical protein
MRKLFATGKKQYYISGAPQYISTIESYLQFLGVPSLMLLLAVRWMLQRSSIIPFVTES